MHEPTLVIPEGDPWTVSTASLSIVAPDPEQPTGHGSRETSDGRLDVQRFGDGQHQPYSLVFRFWPNADSAPRYPTLPEFSEGIDRLVPVHVVMSLPQVIAGHHGLSRPLPTPGEPLGCIQVGRAEIVEEKPAGLLS